MSLCVVSYKSGCKSPNPLKFSLGPKIGSKIWVQNLRCQNSLCQNDAIFAMKYLLFAIYLFLIQIWILLHNKMGVNFERFGLFSTNASVFNLFNFDSQTKIIKSTKYDQWYEKNHFCCIKAKLKSE